MTKIHLIVFLLFFLNQPVFALDKAQSRYGELSIQAIGDYERGLFLDSDLIYKSEVEYLDIEKLFSMANNDIVLISKSTGGSGDVLSYFFVNITPDLHPVVAESFFANLAEIRPIQKKDQIIIDLGYNEGKRERLVYNRDGRQLVERVEEKIFQNGDEDICNFLYNNIYVPFVHSKRCDDAPEEIGGMATSRSYYSILHDPHFNLEQFEELSRSSCRVYDLIKYSEFRNKICRIQYEEEITEGLEN